jgi:hypothetical protein
MKNLARWCFVAATLGCSGCGGIGRIAEIAVVPNDVKADPKGADEASKKSKQVDEDDWWAGLREAKKEIETGAPARQESLAPMSKSAQAELLDQGRVLPATFESSALIRKLVRVADASLTSESATDVEIEASDVREFVADGMSKMSSEIGGSTFAVARNALKSKVHDVFEKYLIAYYKGKFVDRAGRSIAMPQIQGSISNDTITGFVHVLMEAFYDSMFRGLPAFYKLDGGKEVWLNAGKTAPTGVALGTIKKLEVKKAENPPKPEISEDAVDVMAYLADLGAEQSKAVSGWVLREFNDVTLSFVVGGNFAIGDNDTFSKVVDELLQTASRRTIEASMYGYFRKHPLAKDQSEAIQRLIKLVGEVRKALEK